MSPSILICDDHPLMREGLASLLAGRPGWRILAHADNGLDAVRLAVELTPDIAVLDLAMPGMNGIEAAARIAQEAPSTAVVALSMYGDRRSVKRMLGAGARAYVLKSEASEELVRAIEAVLDGQTFLSPALAAAEAPARPAAVQLEALTERERQVLKLIAEGHRTKEVADALGIGVKTVETHRTRIMLKLGADGLVDLIKIAIRCKLVSLE